MLKMYHLLLFGLDMNVQWRELNIELVSLLNIPKINCLSIYCLLARLNRGIN